MEIVSRYIEQQRFGKEVAVHCQPVVVGFAVWHDVGKVFNLSIKKKILWQLQEIRQAY